MAPRKTHQTHLPGIRRRDAVSKPLPSVAPAAASSAEVVAAPPSPAGPISWLYIALAGSGLLAAFVFSYWHTLAEMIATWDREPDYSHGYLVVPLAIWFLWVRRDRFPGVSHRHAWVGLVIIGLGSVLRIYGLAIASSLDGWSILPWAFGATWVLVGGRAACWSLPSIAFLTFMVPLPFSAESLLSVPLQSAATSLSVASFQFLGLPAIAEGNVILIDEHRLEVAQACSGLRIFVGIVALAFAYLIAFRRIWWQKILILLAITPIALVANASRIVLTGLLYQFASSEAAQKFSHDFAGWIMIPLAAALFGMLLWYLDRLLSEQEIIDNRTVIAGDQGVPIGDNT